MPTVCQPSAFAVSCLLCCVLLLLPRVKGATTTGSACITSCVGLADGNYQSCTSCTVFESCVNQILFPNRPCSPFLSWDDNKKACDWTSDTCTAVTSAISTTVGNGPSSATSPTLPSCITDCTGIPDGSYQSCTGCSFYTTCFSGASFPDRVCPGLTLWDDLTKRCSFTSQTCVRSTMSVSVSTTGSTTLPSCITSCTGLPDNSYQSCTGCSFYTTCLGGAIFADRVCPSNTVWDDNIKRCTFQSNTCTTSPASVSTTGSTTMPPCITSCSGLADGNYQSCRGCQFFATCVSGTIFDPRSCPGLTEWDDVTKRCEFVSMSCTISSTMSSSPSPSMSSSPSSSATSPSNG